MSSNEPKIFGIKLSEISQFSIADHATDVTKKVITITKADNSQMAAIFNASQESKVRTILNGVREVTPTPTPASASAPNSNQQTATSQQEQGKLEKFSDNTVEAKKELYRLKGRIEQFYFEPRNGLYRLFDKKLKRPINRLIRSVGTNELKHTDGYFHSSKPTSEALSTYKLVDGAHLKKELEKVIGNEEAKETLNEIIAACSEKSFYNSRAIFLNDTDQSYKDRNLVKGRKTWALVSVYSVLREVLADTGLGTLLPYRISNGSEEYVSGTTANELFDHIMLNNSGSTGNTSVSGAGDTDIYSYDSKRRDLEMGFIFPAFENFIGRMNEFPDRVASSNYRITGEFSDTDYAKITPEIQASFAHGTTKQRILEICEQVPEKLINVLKKYDDRPDIQYRIVESAQKVYGKLMEAELSGMGQGFTNPVLAGAIKGNSSTPQRFSLRTEIKKSIATAPWLLAKNSIVKDANGQDVTIGPKVELEKLLVSEEDRNKQAFKDLQNKRTDRYKSRLQEIHDEYAIAKKTGKGLNPDLVKEPKIDEPPKTIQSSPFYIVSALATAVLDRKKIKSNNPNDKGNDMENSKGYKVLKGIGKFIWPANFKTKNGDERLIASTAFNLLWLFVLLPVIVVPYVLPAILSTVIGIGAPIVLGALVVAGVGAVIYKSVTNKQQAKAEAAKAAEADAKDPRVSVINIEGQNVEIRLSHTRAVQVDSSGKIPLYITDNSGNIYEVTDQVKRSILADQLSALPLKETNLDKTYAADKANYAANPKQPAQGAAAAPGASPVTPATTTVAKSATRKFWTKGKVTTATILTAAGVGGGAAIKNSGSRADYDSGINIGNVESSAVINPYQPAPQILSAAEQTKEIESFKSNVSDLKASAGTEEAKGEKLQEMLYKLKESGIDTKNNPEVQKALEDFYSASNARAEASNVVAIINGKAGASRVYQVSLGAQI